jgi:SPP1 gp7 family putative phage head morphogenesis protein
VADPKPFNVDPVEAIAFLRQKIRLPTRAWTDLWEGQHARAFVVAGAQSDALLADFHEAVTKAIAEGGTLEDFRKDFDRIVAAHGWSYKGSPGWRSKVIFQTNLRTAYSAGRWEQLQRVKKVRPYLRYVAVLDGRTRPLHRHWHGTVLPIDDDWWKTHFPPNGWNCRCSVQSVSERDLARFGFKLSPAAPPSPLVDRTINTPDGPVTIQVPEGIDPGFGYNVGMAGVGRGPENLALEKHGKWTALDAPGAPPVPPRPLPVDVPKAAPGPQAPPGDAARMRELLREAIGGDEKIFTDPTGDRVQVGQAIVDHILESPARQDGREGFFPLIPEVIQDPAEIWVGFARNEATGRVLLRRRYVKLIQLDKDRTIGIVADADGNQWSGLTFFRGNKAGAKLLRQGLLAWWRKLTQEPEQSG